MKDGLGIENVVISGDFNTDFSRRTSYHTSSLEHFINRYNFRSWKDSEFCTADFSYESKINGNRSLIYHFLLTESLFSELLSADVLHAGDNLSDHSPIAIRMRIPVSLVCSMIDRPTASNTRSAWGMKHLTRT